MLPKRSRIDELTSPGSFWWATGIEDTFITSPHKSTGRTLDEYELTGHYEQWRDDLRLMAELGVRAARYGIPWHRVQPRPGEWNWEFPDKTLNLMLELGIAPQVDLVHYGLPAWIERGYLHPDYPRFVAEYASRLAERFKGRIHWYTPLNEPRITAWYCGRLGWWPPQLRSWQGFASLMIAICRGIVATVRALELVDREIVPYHVDATDLFASATADLAAESELRQNIVFLALDLVSGRVDDRHPLRRWLLQNGIAEAELDAFLDDPLELSVIGLNLYPMFTNKLIFHDTKRRQRIRAIYADGTLLSCLASLYYKRYRAPLMVSETASLGSVQRREAWLDASVRAVQESRAAGIPLVGYTWWPMFALIAWAHRQGHRPVADHVLQMGLWDLVPDDSQRLMRTPTSLVARFAELAAHGQGAVGPLAPSRTPIAPSVHSAGS